MIDKEKEKIKQRIRKERGLYERNRRRKYLYLKHCNLYNPRKVSSFKEQNLMKPEPIISVKKNKLPIKIKIKLFINKLWLKLTAMFAIKK